MLIKNLENSTFFNRRNIVGIDYVTSSEDEVDPSYCIVEKAYKQINLKKFGTASLSELKKFTRRKDIQLNVSGKQVLIKQIQIGEETDSSALIAKVIPAGRASEFYYQLVAIQEQTWCAVIRREVLEEILLRFAQHKMNVIRVSLGPLNAAVFKDWIDPATLTTSTNVIKNVPGGVAIEKRENSGHENQVIREKTVSNLHVNAFAAGLEYHKEGNVAFGSLESTNRNWAEARYDQMKLIIGGCFGFAMVIILSTNFFLRSSYEEALEKLNLVNAQNEEAYQMLLDGQNELSNKSALLVQNGMDKSGMSAYISDRVAASILPGVKLLRLNLFPLEKNMKQGERTVFGKQLLITGVASESIDLNRWTLALNELEFVEDVTINNYSQSDRENPGIFDVVVQLR